MIVDLQTNETAPIAIPAPYVFIDDVELVHVGGGSAIVDY